MTQRLYYADSYTQHFTAQVVEQLHLADHPAVVLDQTYFYPTGGGQPYDLGTLNGIPVVDVQTRPNDQAILHLLSEPLTGDSAEGQVEWRRRFDHMQQHTGQHILSRAFIELRQAETVGFHLSENTLTIDLNQEDIPLAEVDAVEALANQIIAENRPVRAWFPTPEELTDLNLRKLSDKVTGAVRVVDIGGFDLCACGGTHVAHTGELGQIKVIRLEKNKKVTRLEFRCGTRALDDYRQKNNLLLQLASQMTVGYWDLPNAFERLQEENKSLGRDLKAAKTQLLAYEAEALWHGTMPTGTRVVIAQAFEGRETADLNGLASALVKHPQTVVFLGLAGEKGHLVFGASEDEGVDVVPLLKKTLEQLGSKSGGGRPTLAQGGGFSIAQNALQPMLNQLKASL